MAFSSENPKKPHAVFVPFPTQGHINPLLKLAKLLHYRGFHITFVNAEFNHNRLVKSKGSNVLQNLPHFCFETIPDGLPPSDINATQDLAALCESTRKNCLVPFGNLVKKLNDSPGSLVPPVSCVIADGAMSFTLQVSQELNIPNVLFWTFGACGFLGFKLQVDLISREVTPFKDTFLTNITDKCWRPILCLPCLSEQPTNCRFVCAEWGIGLEIGDLKRGEIGRVVRELMDGEEGKKMKKRALGCKEKATEAARGPYV
ncbi:7-deoxyloganetin glucosyltransferase [Handroanthus impetiginosus]|uniref:7-deoxyloganetin glucosyltransferase n=1 Tax=Handroanthus impetiginosus TaxID=429701 RepID=A0A2G9FXD1_9LAMI|nr:7-deoxyloganetin glucosyltransferase [Handroanthus impetiginosus]